MEIEIKDSLVKEGDNNTKKFHHIVDARRNGNFISSLEINGFGWKRRSIRWHSIFLQVCA